MRRLFTILSILILVSCATVQTTETKNSDFTMEGITIFYKGNKIGAVDAIKLEKEGNKVKREISIVLENNSQNMQLAPELIDFITKDSEKFKKTDIEIKFRF